MKLYLIKGKQEATVHQWKLEERITNASWQQQHIKSYLSIPQLDNILMLVNRNQLNTLFLNHIG